MAIAKSSDVSTAHKLIRRLGVWSNIMVLGKDLIAELKSVKSALLVQTFSFQRDTN